jgi:hypothetical protein
VRAMPSLTIENYGREYGPCNAAHARVPILPTGAADRSLQNVGNRNEVWISKLWAGNCYQRTKSAPEGADETNKVRTTRIRCDYGCQRLLLLLLKDGPCRSEELVRLQQEW